MNNGCLSILSAFNQSLPSKPPWLRRSLQQDHPYIMHNHRPHFIMGFDASNQGKKSPQMFKWWPFHGQCMLKKCAYNLTPMIFKGVMVVAIWCKLHEGFIEMDDKIFKICGKKLKIGQQIQSSYILQQNTKPRLWCGKVSRKPGLTFELAALQQRSWLLQGEELLHGDKVVVHPGNLPDPGLPARTLGRDGSEKVTLHRLSGRPGIGRAAAREPG